MHCLIDAVLEQKTRYRLNPSDIEAVTVRLLGTYLEILPFIFPKNDAEARFSLTYCLATALVTGDLQPDDFTEAAVERSEIRALIPLITIEKHIDNPQEQDTPETVPDMLIMRLKDGRIIKKVADKAVGMPDSPLSRSELMEKFNRCAGTVLSETRARQLQGLLQDFAELQDLTELMHLLRG
jgi:2-methylcitrate dehydratase PrpD